MCWPWTGNPLLQPGPPFDSSPQCPWPTRHVPGSPGPPQELPTRQRSPLPGVQGEPPSHLLQAGWHPGYGCPPRTAPRPRFPHGLPTLPPSTVSPPAPPVLPQRAMRLPSIAHAHVCQDGEQCWGAVQGGGSCPCGVYRPRVTQGEATHSLWGPGCGGGVAVARALAPKAQPTCEGPEAPSRGREGRGPRRARPDHRAMGGTTGGVLVSVLDRLAFYRGHSGSRRADRTPCWDGSGLDP